MKGLKKILKIKGKTVQFLMDFLGVKKSTAYKYLSGEREINYTDAYNIAEELGVSMESLR